MLCALNGLLRRERRRLAVIAVVLGLAGAVLVAHTAMDHDHIGDAVVMCLAVVETAVMAVGAAVAAGLMRVRFAVPVSGLFAPSSAAVPLRDGVRARAGPVRLQVFRL